MDKHLIKICGIRDPLMAYGAAAAGADLLGMVFHPGSPRNVSLEQAREISKRINQSSASMVGVFVDQNEVEIQRICESLGINIVQLHGRASRSAHHRLPSYYRRIYALAYNGICNDDPGLRYLDSSRDFILIDNVQPGQGKLFNRQDFRYTLPFPWILAGGLSPSNVVAAIHDLKPQGIDVSSGVESSKGKKDLQLIKQFITTVRSLNDAT